MEIGFQLTDYEEYSLKKIKPYFTRAFIGYFLISLGLGQFLTIDKISIYLYSYYYHKSKEGIKTSRRLLSEILLLSQAVSLIPITLILKSEKWRTKVYAFLAVTYSAALASMYFIDNYVTLSLLIGGMGGLAKASVCVFPSLELRNYLSKNLRTVGMFAFILTVIAFQNFIAFSAMMFVDSNIPDIDHNSGVVPFDSCEYAKKRFALSSIFSLLLVIPGITIIRYAKKTDKKALNKEQKMVKDLSMDYEDLKEFMMPDDHHPGAEKVIKKTEPTRIKFAFVSLLVFTILFLRDSSNFNLLDTMKAPISYFKFPYFGQSCVSGFVPFFSFPLFTILLSYRGKSSPNYSLSTYTSILIACSISAIQVFFMNSLSEKPKSAPLYLTEFLMTSFSGNFTYILVFCFCCRYLYNRRFTAIAVYFTLKSWVDYTGLKMNLYIGNSLQPQVSIGLTSCACVALLAYGFLVVRWERKISERMGYSVNDQTFIEDFDIKQMVEEIKKEQAASDFRSSQGTEQSFKSDFSCFAKQKFGDGLYNADIDSGSTRV